MAESKRGGRREGAGRKPRGMYGPKTKTVTARVSEETKRKIDYVKERGWSLSYMVESKVNDVYNMITKGMFSE